MKSPALVAVAGLPGVGKSTVARMIAHRLDASLIQTDAVRKTLVAKPDYSEAETERTYRRMFDLARARLRAGYSVVLDATFFQAEMRKTARALSERLSAEWHLILVTAPDSWVRQRIGERQGDVSDADYNVHLKMKVEFEPIDEPFIEIQNCADLKTLDVSLDQLFPCTVSPSRGIPG